MRKNQLMVEITIEECRKKAKLWHAQKDSWHFHVLAPHCAFNTRRDTHALVLENRTVNRTYVVFSDDKFVKVSQELVKLLHGDRILDKDKATTSRGSEKIQVVLQKASESNQGNLAWHHHMLFPDCIFNEHRGKWNIVFEDKQDDSVVEILYDVEPVDDLRLIEVLYFHQTDPSFRDT